VLFPFLCEDQHPKARSAAIDALVIATQTTVQPLREWLTSCGPNWAPAAQPHSALRVLTKLALDEDLSLQSQAGEVLLQLLEGIDEHYRGAAVEPGARVPPEAQLLDKWVEEEVPWLLDQAPPSQRAMDLVAQSIDKHHRARQAYFRMLSRKSSADAVEAVIKMPHGATTQYAKLGCIRVIRACVRAGEPLLGLVVRNHWLLGFAPLLEERAPGPEGAKRTLISRRHRGFVLSSAYLNVLAGIVPQLQRSSGNTQHPESPMTPSALRELLAHLCAQRSPLHAHKKRHSVVDALFQAHEAAEEEWQRPAPAAIEHEVLRQERRHAERQEESYFDDAAVDQDPEPEPAEPLPRELGANPPPKRQVEEEESPLEGLLKPGGASPKAGPKRKAVKKMLAMPSIISTTVKTEVKAEVKAEIKAEPGVKQELPEESSESVAASTDTAEAERLTKKARVA